jgi:hypothetical protein
MTAIRIDVTADIVEPELYLVEPEVMTDEEVPVANRVLRLQLTDDCEILLHHYQAEDLLAVLARAIAPHYEDSEDSEEGLEDAWRVTARGEDFLGQLPRAEDETKTEEVA